MATQSYDPKILQQFADDLYGQARSKEMSGLLAGLLLGVVGPILAVYLSWDLAQALGFTGLVIASAVGGVLGAFAGFSSGKSKAFFLRLQAQQVLCQVAIEANTNATYVAVNGAP